MELSRLRAWAQGLATVLLLSAAVAGAQPALPHENHYNVYRTIPLTYTRPITLIDQFGPIDVSLFVLDKFANPAEKRIPETGDVYPIINPDIHQLWWRIDAPQPARTIVGIDQFGIAQWHLGDAAYLLNPALKNVPPPAAPPEWNHYLCYHAQGPTVGRPVIVIDQFGTSNVVVLYGKLFCNPVEKRHADGITYPIVDPVAHLACYLVQNATPFTRSITAIDQFGYWQLETFENDCLCLPALKEHVLKTQESTWGKIKAMYQ
ncbi:MAG TPA: hypothetical protein VEC56_11685 [Candidatus Krumholzibacteria bacterium]|nr:hypothetical protein [Candidatus Krumholzibacteria bacterium]